MLYQNLPDYRNSRTGVRPQPLTVRRPLAATPQPKAPLRGRMPLPEVSKRPSLARPLAGVFVVGLLLFTMSYAIFSSNGIAKAFSAFTTSSEEKAAADKQGRIQSYTSGVNALIAAHPDQNVTVSTIDLSDNSAVTLGDPGTYTAASTAKLITAITYLDQVEKGRASLTKKINGETAQFWLQRMIVDSDNGAWQNLNDYLTHDTLQTYMARQGWAEYDPAVNTLLPAYMAELMQKLYQGELLDKDRTSLLLSYMEDANKQDYIVGAVPDGYKVYHKAGWLNGLMHDVAIISDGQKTIVLAIYTFQDSGEADNTDNQELFKSITQAALQTYFN